MLNSQDKKIYPSKTIFTSAWFIVFALALTWGTSFILIKKSLIAFDPYQIAGLRVFIASLCFLPFIIIRRKKIDWSKLGFFMIVGVCGTLLPSFLFPFAQQKLDSSIAGLLNSMGPIFTLLIGVALFATPLEKRKIVGIILGFIGAGLLLMLGQKMDSLANLYYGFFILLATILYSLAANVIEFKLQHSNAMTISAVSFGLAGIPGLFILLGFDFIGTMRTHPKAWEAFAYVSFLSLFSTVLASIVFFYLIKKSSAVFASTVAYLIPIVALGWGALDGEIITLFHFLGMGLILYGVYVTKGKQAMTKP